MHIHLKIIGILLIALAFIHLIFPKYFDWKNDLKGLSLINRQIIQVHTFFIALTVLMMGVLCLTSATELISTKLGHHISIGLAIFWSIRLVIQFFGYSSKLWRGKRFETFTHIAFALLWTYFSFVFFKVYFNG